MACRVKRRYKVAYLDTVSPSYVEVLRTYTRPQGVAIYPGEAEFTQLGTGYGVYCCTESQFLWLC